MANREEARAEIARLVADFQQGLKAGHRDLNSLDFKKQAITYAYNKGGAFLTNCVYGENSFLRIGHTC